MQNKVLAILILLFFSAVQLTAQSDTLAFSILKKTKSAIESIKTMRYDVDYYAYYEDNEGNEHKKAKVQIKRVPDDLQFLIQDSLAAFSDNGLLYQKIIWKDSTLTFMTKEQSKKYTIGAKRDYTIEAYSYINRLSAYYLGILHEPVQEVVFDSKPCYKLVFYKDFIHRVDTNRIFYTYFIDKATFLLIKEEWYAKYAGQKEVRELYNIDINPNLSDAIFDVHLNLPSYISVKPYVEPSNIFGDSVRIMVAEPSKPFLSPNTPSPDWALQDIKGNTIRSKDLKGKVVLIDFWFIACDPCKKAIPSLKQLYADYKDKGLVVLGFNTLDLSTFKIQAYKTQYAIDYPLVLCTENVTKSFRVEAFPTFCLLDKEGKIVENHEGFSLESSSKLSEKIKALLTF
jgi:thiol-disulfide isomerase/thioredoxin